ncbi:MAG: hypothetical protein AAGK78_06355 [Planctomycetota bacterium]
MTSDCACNWLLISAAIFAFGWLGFSLVVVFFAALVNRARVRTAAAKENTHADAVSELSDASQFALDFEEAGAARIWFLDILVWQSFGKHRYFVRLEDSLLFVTKFNDGTVLETLDNGFDHCTPLPRNFYRQTMATKDVDALYQHHLDAEAELMDTLQIRPQSCDETSFADFFQRYLREDTGYVLLRPWIWLALPWRFLVTAQRYRRVSVVEQIRRGWVKIEARSPAWQKHAFSC